MNSTILIRGGGDLASGVAYRLHRAGLRVLVTELPQPLVVRRKVSFAEAVFEGSIQIDGVLGQLAQDEAMVSQIIDAGNIAVLVDPDLSSLTTFEPLVLIDARMIKRAPEIGMEAAPLVVGLGPGFDAGQNCHAVIETIRGHDLGRVIWEGKPVPDTGIPEAVLKKQGERVLRAPIAGELTAEIEIGTVIKRGQIIATVSGQPILAPFEGVLRGLIHSGLVVKAGMKVGDLDPRDDPSYAFRISDKALAIGGGVLEAVLSVPAIREKLWQST